MTTPTGAPEAYATYNVPDGYTLDEKVIPQVNSMFKEMNLSQEHAQRLVSFYAEKSMEAANEPYKVWNDMQEKWVNEIKADPQIGPRLNEVKTTISRAIDMLDPQLAAGFREAMDFTGAGNNPAFIKAFWKWASMITEGRHIAGGGPTKQGQTPPGQSSVSAAGAMYPNLPRA